MDNEKLVSIINGYISIIKKTGKLPEPLKAASNLSVKDLMDVIYWLLKIDRPDINFTPAYPSYILWNFDEQRDYVINKDNPTEKFKPTITYRTVREMPAGFAEGGEPFSGYRNFNYILMEEKKFEDRIIQVKQKSYETLVQFELWDIEHETLDRLYEWFRRYLTLCRPLFKYIGIENFFYWGGGEYSVDQNLNKKLNRRVLLFYVRTQEIYNFERTDILREVRMTIEAIGEKMKKS